MKPPKCRFCPEFHWGPCPNVGKKQVRAKVAEIEARPKPVPGTRKPKAKKKAAAK